MNERHVLRPSAALLLPAVALAGVLLAGCSSSAPSTGPASSLPASASPAASTAPGGPTAASVIPGAEDDTAAILHAGRDRTQAMLERDIARLDQLLADGFTAIHINGYQQPKDEWLEQIASGEMTYHDVAEVSSTVTIHGDTAVLTTRNLVTATIDGSDGTWPLESTTHYARDRGVWLATSSRSTTY